MSDAKPNRPGRWQAVASLCLAVAPVPTVAVGGWDALEWTLWVSVTEVLLAILLGVVAVRRGERVLGYIGQILGVLVAAAWFFLCWMLLSYR